MNNRKTQPHKTVCKPKKTQHAIEEFKKLPKCNTKIFEPMKKLNKLKPHPHQLVKLETANSQNKQIFINNTEPVVATQVTGVLESKRENEKLEISSFKNYIVLEKRHL